MVVYQPKAPGRLFFDFEGWSWQVSGATEQKSSEWNKLVREIGTMEMLKVHRL